ncbi:MAG: porin [Aquificaceae bacterium]
MRKTLLALAALMGVATLPEGAQAVAFRIADDVRGNMGFRGQFWLQGRGERVAGNKGDIDISLRNVRLYANGEISKYMYFGANLDFTPNTARASDAFAGIKFQDEFRVQMGIFRTPFGRASLTDSYTFLVPTGYFYGIPDVANTLQGAKGTTGLSSYRNAQVAVWGDIADATFKYYLSVFDGPYNNDTTQRGSDKLGVAFRVQFTPTMLGFKGEKGYGLRDTYLGRQNVLSFGAGYIAQKCEIPPGPALNLGGTCATTATTTSTTSYTTSGFVLDAKHEQRFGKEWIAGWEAAYFGIRDINAAKDDQNGFYLQVGAIYDKKAGVGKPGFAVRYDYSENKPSRGSKQKFSRIGGAFNYFIKGQDAMVQFGVDTVNRPAGQKDYSDVTLAFQVQF